MIGIPSFVPSAARAGITLAVCSGLYLQPYRTMMVVGQSMSPTYKSLSYKLTLPVEPEQLERGMVVIIHMESGPIVKRIAFLPGDRFLQVKSGDSWFDMIFLHPTDQKSMRNLKTRVFTVPPGEVYVLGDNQAVSQDSKYFGCVDVTQIDRKVVDQRPFDYLCLHGCSPSIDN